MLQVIFLYQCRNKIHLSFVITAHSTCYSKVVRKRVELTAEHNVMFIEVYQEKRGKRLIN